MAVSPDFWRGRKVLLTGHTGFKGGWLALWLRQLGADLRGLGNDQPGGGALGVILCCKRARHQSQPRPVAGQRCHDDAIGKLQRACRQRVKKGKGRRRAVGRVHGKHP